MIFVLANNGCNDAVGRELRTLFFCEMVHQVFDKKYSSGTADDYIDKHRHNRDLLDSSPTAE